MTKDRAAVLGASADPASPEARITVDLFLPEGAPRGLAVTIHGRNGDAASPHMRKVIGPYLNRGYVVVAPNLSASEHNDAAGTGADFTISGHVRDARRVIDWAIAEAGRRGWPRAPLALAGHSMGGYAALRIAAEDEEGRYAHVLAVSTFTTGERQLAVRMRLAPDAVEILARECPAAVTDWPRHDILADARRLTLPVAVVAGAGDMITPPANCKELFDRLPNGVCWAVMPEAHHCMEGPTSEAVIGGALAVLEAARAAREPRG